MAAKRSGCLGGVLSTLFTSILAPVLVHVLTDGSLGGDAPHTVPPAHTSPASSPLPTPAVDAPAVVVEGTGRTPEEARAAALRVALCTAAAGLVDAPTWEHDGARIGTTILADPAALVLRERDLRCTPGGGGWRREVVVSVDGAALARRLRAAGVRVSGEAR